MANPSYKEITLERVSEEIDNAIKFCEIVPGKKVTYVNLRWRRIGGCAECWEVFLSTSAPSYIEKGEMIASSELSPDDFIQSWELATRLIERLKEWSPPEPRLLKTNKESKDNG